MIALLESPVLSGIITPVLTLLALGLLRYVQKEITGAIASTRESVLKEVKAVDLKVDGVIAEQSAVREALKTTQERQQVDRERIARLEGRRDAQIEAAQIANAAAVAVDVITHRETPT